MKRSRDSTTRHLLIALVVLIALALIAAARNRFSPATQMVSTSPSPTATVTTTSTPLPSSPSPTSTSSTTPSPTPSPSPTPAQSGTYTNATYGFQAAVPSGYRVVDQVLDNGSPAKSDRTVLITNDPSISAIAPGHCLPGFMFSVITPTTDFSTYAKKESWNFIDNLTVTQTTINSLPTIELSGQYNQQYVYYSPNTNVKISLFNLGNNFLEMTSCASGAEVDAVTYGQIETSVTKK